MNDNEMVDIVDGDGNTVGTALKTEAHRDSSLHKIVIGYLRRGNDWSLIRQAADRQDAGQLAAPVGGHVQAGESELHALLRESEEEIGTSNITYRHVGNATFHRQVIGRDENHLYIVYEIATDDPVKLGAESVSIENFTARELKSALVEHPKNFGDGYYFILEQFYPDYLPSSYQKRWTQ